MREAMDRAARTGSAVDLCRVALKLGKLVRDGRHWRYGRRRFSNATVKRLIDEGVAIRIGNVVRSSMDMVHLQHRPNDLCGMSSFRSLHPKSSSAYDC
jgi:hypothetical protein